MSFDLGQPWEDSGIYESAGPRLTPPSQSSSINPSMSQRRKPLAVPQQCRQPAMGSSESREAHKATNRLSKQRPVSSSLGTGHFPAQDTFSPLGTSRYSHAYLAGSQGCLLLDQSQPESESSSSGTPPAEKDNLAARSNKPELQLQPSALSKRSKSSTSLVVKSPGFPNELSRIHIPRHKSTVVRSQLSPLSPVSPASPTSSRRHSTDNQERQTTSTDPSFAKLDLIPISPLNPNFLDEFQASPSTRALKHEMFREPDYTSAPSRPAFEQPVPPASGFRASMPCIPMRRRSLIQTPGLATRLPPSNKLHGLADGLRSPTSIASVLAGSADGQTEAGKTNVSRGAGSSSARKVQKHLSLPNLPKLKEQERCVTPCESDYQQLGGMKFGTLRITNASPVPSSRIDSDEDQPTRQKATSSVSDANQGVSSSQRGPHGASNLFITNCAPSSTTDETENTTQDIQKHSSPAPYNSGRGRSLSLLENPRIEPTSKRLSSLMELIEEPRDDCGQELLSVPSQTASRPLDHQQLSVKMASQDKTGVEYSAKEILDIRVDPSAKPVREDSENKARNRSVQKVISSSDSGFVSATSSLSSRRTLSNSDSAYSSNASIQSKTVGLESAIVDKWNSREHLKPDTKHLKLTDDHMKGSTHGSFISMSKSSIRRLSSRIRPRHSIHSISFSETAGTPRGQSPNQSSKITNTFKSENNIMQDSAVILRGRASSVSQKTGKLQRLFAPPKKDGFSAGYASHYIEFVPTVPFDVEERLREHSRVFPTTSMRLTKQSNRSEESLKTIISVESNAENNVEHTERNYTRDSLYDQSSRYDGSNDRRRSHKSHKSMNSMDSIKSLNSLASSRTIKSIASSKSVQSSSSAQEFKDTKTFQIDASHVGPTYQVKDEEQYSQRLAPYATISAVLPERNSWQKASLKRKPVPFAKELPQEDTQAAGSKIISNSMQHTSQGILSDGSWVMTHAQNNSIRTLDSGRPVAKLTRARVDSGSDACKLKARVSAPNLSTSLPSSTEVFMVSQRSLPTMDLTKELPLEPPRQPLLRSSFSRWSRGQDRMAERKCSWPRNSSFEDLRSYQFHPSQTRSQSTTVLPQDKRQEPQDIQAFKSKRRHSTLIHRPAFSESLAIASLKRPKKGPKQPYRILHSYNSPAYKNVPIWG